MRSEPFFPAAIVLILGLLMSASIFMSTVPLNGDEHFYNESAKLIAGFLKGDVAWDEMSRKIVGYGWFMPGMSIISAPIHVFWMNAPVPLLRLQNNLIVVLVFVLVYFDSIKFVGQKYSKLLLVSPLLIFTWLCFASTLWGDLLCGLLFIPILLRVIHLSKYVVAVRKLSIKTLFQIEILISISIYLRGNAYILGIAIHIFLLCILLARPVSEWSWKEISKLFAGFVFLIFTVMPWSYMAGQILGGRVTTTTTLPLSLAVTFGAKEKICFGPCEEGKNIWIAAAGFSRKSASNEKISELEVQKKMAQFALKDLSLKDYLLKTRDNFRRYFFEPAMFLKRFIRLSHLNIPKESKIYSIGQWMTNLIYFPFLFVLLGFNVVVYKSIEGSIDSLVVKMFTISLAVQPFVHISLGRYWPAFIPLAAIATGFLLKRKFPGENHPKAFVYQYGSHSLCTSDDNILLSRTLYIFQLLYSIIFSSIIIFLLLI